MIVMRCGRGMQGCDPLTNAERLQRYAFAAAVHMDHVDRAVRAAAGLAHMARLTKLWKRKKRKARPAAKKRKNNVVLLKRRA